MEGTKLPNLFLTKKIGKLIEMKIINIIIKHHLDLIKDQVKVRVKVL